MQINFAITIEVMCITICMQDQDGTMDDLASERTVPENRGVQQNKTKTKTMKIAVNTVRYISARKKMEVTNTR